ncbi:hypothetical protein L3X38_019821 [Prunus dulcis]|uniref:Uncharacterized protein n=1 Tax=Prunus dulcis TaxID=3755 RepID=A0AAD4WEE1_PRUDU|nr:hypothetical protein L3X38_019821 [Prunus dulcis]
MFLFKSELELLRHENGLLNGHVGIGFASLEEKMNFRWNFKVRVKLLELYRIGQAAPGSACPFFFAKGISADNAECVTEATARSSPSASFVLFGHSSQLQGCLLLAW